MAIEQCRIRIAAAGDIHYGERADDRERAHATFAALEGRADVILLAGDLTTHGEPEQAAIVADVVRDVERPRARRDRATTTGTSTARDEFCAVLEEAGVRDARSARATTTSSRSATPRSGSPA